MPRKDSTERSKYQSGYRERRGENLLKDKRTYWRGLRMTVLNHYSSGALKCACCGEGTYEFLSIDHIAGGGNQHRKSLGSKYIYSWLIHQGFPEGYQVLCHNCNMAKAFYKVCPHMYKSTLAEQAFPDADALAANSPPSA